MMLIISLRNVGAITLTAAALISGCGGNTPEAMLASGKEYVAKQDNKAAVIQFKNALQKNPEMAEARFLLGRALLETGDIPGAEKELRKAAELNYPAEQVNPLLARTLVLLGEHKKVVDEFSRADVTAPEGKAELQTAIAQAHLALGNTEAARASFARALAAQPDHVPAQVGQARLAAIARDYAKALATVDAALAKKPNYVDGWYLKAEIFVAQGQQEPALNAYRKTVEIKRDFLAGHSAITSLLLQQNKLDDASKQLDTMRQIAPKHPQTLYLQALLAYHQKNFVAAREAIQQQLVAVPDNILGLMLAGGIEYELKSYASAEAHLLKVLQRVPGQPFARRILVSAYLRNGDVDKAFNTLKPVLNSIEKDPRMLGVAGEVYMMKGENARASEYFAKAAALDPNDAVKRTALAVSLVAKGETEKGLHDLEQISADDTGVRADLALISVHMRRAEYAKALAAIAVLEKKRPESPAPHTLRGRVLLATKDVPGARRSFERALELNPAYFPAIASLARLDLADKKPEAVQRRLDAALAKDPKHLQALLAMAELRARTGGSSSDVVQIINKAVSVHPNDPAPRIALIGYQMGINDPKKAVTAAQEALAAIPNDPGLLDAAGRAYLAAGDSNQALTVYQKLASLQPASPHAHLRIAAVHLAEKNSEAAAASLRKAVSLKPDLVEAQQGLISLAVGAGRVQEAVAIAQQAQKQRPKESVGYVLEGDIYAAGKKWPEAIAAYRRGLKQIESTDLASRLHSALFTSGSATNAEEFAAKWLKDHPKGDSFRLYLAEAAMARRDYATATQHYRKVLDTQPNNAVVLNNLAWTSAQLKDPKAIEHAEQANKLAPDQPAIMDTLGTLLLAKGETARAVELLRKASAMAPQAPNIRLNLAKGLIKAGQNEAAKKELDELAKLGDKFSAHAEVTQLKQGL